jgi:hypothetical protein
VAKIVESTRREAGGLEGGMPVPPGEVVHVEWPATRRGKHESRVEPAREGVEGPGRATGERHPTAAPLRLRLLHATAGDDATNVHDARVAVDVPLLEGGQLAGPQASLRGEHDHRPVQSAELAREAVDLRTCEWLDLGAPGHAPLAGASEPDRVLGDQLPGDGAVENLRQGTEDLRPITVR